MDWRLREWLDELLTGRYDSGTFDLVERFLNEEPEQVAHLITIFERETDPEKKCLLGLFIVKHQAHPGVVEFLRTQGGWSERDFKGTAVKGV